MQFFLGYAIGLIKKNRHSNKTKKYYNCIIGKFCFYFNTCKNVLLAGLIILINLNKNGLASLAGKVLFVYKLTMPLVVKYKGVATRRSLD